MTTDKDELDARIIIDMVDGDSDKWREIRDYIQRIRAESADQARKEAAERVASAWRVYEEDITLRILREAILGDSVAVSTDSEKLSIAVKALEDIDNAGNGSHCSIIARDALKEIQEHETPCPNCPYHIPAGHTVCTKCGAIIGEIQQHDLPDFARFENRSNTTTDVDK